MDPENFDTFLTWGSWSALTKAAGTVCAAVDAVTQGRCRNAFCAIRPPGHHAGRNGETENTSSQGFCLINNVAIGATYAVETLGYKRVAVVDFDVHHGNGTEEILDGLPNFLFISIHVYDEKKYFYPGTGSADEGSENVLNVPLKRHAGSSAYFQEFEGKVIPRLEAFDPELIFLSAGFDGHRDDPIKGLRLCTKDYYTLTRRLMDVADAHCGGRLVSVLEGGYDTSPRTQALRNSAKAHVLALMRQEGPGFHDLRGSSHKSSSSSSSSTTSSSSSSSSTSTSSGGGSGNNGGNGGVSNGNTTGGDATTADGAGNDAADVVMDVVVQSQPQSQPQEEGSSNDGVVGAGDDKENGSEVKSESDGGNDGSDVNGKGAVKSNVVGRSDGNVSDESELKAPEIEPLVDGSLPNTPTEVLGAVDVKVENTTSGMTVESETSAKDVTMDANEKVNTNADASANVNCNENESAVKGNDNEVKETSKVIDGEEKNEGADGADKRGESDGSPKEKETEEN